MKILLVHNHYGSAAPSGENLVFGLEREMLERGGHQVRLFERHSDRLRERGIRGAAAGALMTPWNPAAARSLRGVLRDFGPDIVHAHNTFPMISPSIFPAARGCARVLTLHNYRLVCPAAIPMRDGTPCTDCIDRRSVWPAVRHGCYRGSRIATLPLAANVALHRARGTWRNDVEQFVALSDFQRDLMARAGLPAARISVKPNFYPGTPHRTGFADRARQVVFAGRLSAEKGVGDLVAAWLAWGAGAPDLRILGDGPLRAALQAQAAGAPNIRFLGNLDRAGAEAEIGAARLLLLPSRWFEGFPMVLREAFAFGTPVGVSDIGPLPGIAAEAEGIVFPPGDAAALLDRVRAAWKTPGRLDRMARASVAAFEARYSEGPNYDRLMTIYARALDIARQRREAG